MQQDSLTLRALNSTVEKITTNYSSDQLLTVLDKMWWSAVRPIVECSSYIDHSLLLLCAGYSQVQRRKLNRWSREKLYAYLMLWPLATVEQKKVMWRKMRLERTIARVLVGNWLAEAEKIIEIHLKVVNKEPLEEWERTQYDYALKYVLQVTDVSNFLAQFTSARSWFNQAIEYRDQLMEKYHRFASTEAVKHVQQAQEKSGARLLVDDVAQTFVLAIAKAIDKCDPHMGTLTAYINTWLRDAKTSGKYRSESGSAFSTTQAHRRKLARKDTTDGVNVENYAVSLDHKSLEGVASESEIDSDHERRERILEVRRLASLADPSGFGLIALNLVPYVEPSELLKRTLA